MSNVYHVSELKSKFLALGLDSQTISILLDDVDNLESLAYYKGYETGYHEASEEFK